MPNGSVNLYFSIQSGSSEQTLVSLSDKTRALDKDTQALKQTTEDFAKASKSLMAEQTRLKAEMKSSQQVVNDLQKAYDEYGDELSRSRLDDAIEQHAKLKIELAEVNAQLNENKKTYKENIEVIRKGGLGEISGGMLSEASDFTKSHIYSELAKPLIGSLGALSESLLTSAIGMPTASLISDTLSSAISGASAGSILGPWGAFGGAALGGLTGGTKIFEKKDDAFKDYYGGLYEDVKGRSGEMVEAGTSLASTRETNRISFTTLFGGDENRARGYLEDLIDMANSTPFLYDDLVSMSKTLATYGYDDSNVLPLLQTIGDAGAALGMSTSDMNTVATALGRMKSSDKAALEWLNMLNDRGIGAVSMLADAYGVSQKDMYGKISAGEISGSEAVEIITAALSRDKEDGGFAGSMAEQSQTFAGISSTLEGLQQNLNALGGEGYNTLRQEGIQAEINALREDDGLGDAIGEINRIMGENQARRENLQDQYMREALDAVLNGNQGKVFNEEQNAKLAELSAQYAQAKDRYERTAGGDAEAGAEMESLFEQAQVLGQAYFENSDFMKMLNDTEIDEIQAIRDNTVGLTEATQASYNLAQELSKGRGNTFFKAIWGEGITEGKGGDISWDGAASNYLGAPKSKQDGYYGYNGIWRPNAFGLSRVPYDDYPALLHRDERVLTASEARAQDAGQGAGSVSLTVTGNNFIGDPEELADQIWEIIVRKLERAYTAAAPK